MYRFLQFIILYIVLCNTAIAADLSNALLHKKQYTPADGLSQSSVYVMEQDLNGFIWLATQSGIDRFDGYSFENFPHSTETSAGLSASKIVDLELDPKTGDLWAASANGLDKINAKTGEITQIKKHNKNGELLLSFSSLHFDYNNHFWFAADAQLFVSNPETQLSKQIEIPGTSRLLRILQIYSSPQNIIFIATNLGILRYNYNNDTWLSTLIPQDIVLSIFIDKNLALWAGTNGNGLFQFTFTDEGEVIKKAQITSEQGLSNSIVNAFVQTKDGSVWVATNEGVTVFPNPTELKPASLAKQNPTSKAIVLSLLNTTSNQTFYGTLVNGFSIVNSKTILFEKVFMENNKATFASTIDNNGTVWATSPTGLWQVDDKLQAKGPMQHVEGDHKHSKNNILLTAHYSSSNNTVWVGTRIGLSRVNNVQNGLESFGFNGISVYAINSDQDGNLFLGTNNNGAYHFNPNNGEILSHYKTTKVLSINVVSPSKVWLATYEGLIKINPLTKTKIVYRHDPKDPNSIAYDMITWTSRINPSTYLVGTQGKGLFMMKEDPASNKVKFTKLFANTALANVSISSIVKDFQGQYWITTIKGIAKMNSSLTSIEFYDATDGVNPSGYFIGSNAIDAQGRIFAPSAGGLTYFHPSKIKQSKSVPPLKITKVDVLNENMGLRVIDAKTNPLSLIEEQELILSADDLIVNINFAALEYVTPNKIEYAYRLSGFNQQWQYQAYKKRSITFTSLGAGTYQLEIKNSNRYGEWNDVPTTLNITVIPVWYLSKVALISWFILALATIYLIVRWRSRVHYIRTKALAAEVAIKTKDLKAANEQLRLLSNLDPLTKVFNRRGFSEAAAKHFLKFTENDKLFSIFLFDVDLFKTINDSFGHDIGDAVLIDIVNRVKFLIRNDDVIGRWGGEEFILLLPDAEVQNAIAVAEKIRRKIYDASIEVGGHKISIAISGGIACISDFQSLDECIKQADILLYKAKQSGRNKICS